MLVTIELGNVLTFVVPVAFSRQGTPTLLDEVCDCYYRLSVLVWRRKVMESEFPEVRQLLHHTRRHKGLTMSASCR